MSAIVRRYIEPVRPTPRFLRLVSGAEVYDRPQSRESVAHRSQPGAFGPEEEAPEAGPSRRPHPAIAGRTQVCGDLLTSVSTTDWDLPE